LADLAGGDNVVDVARLAGLVEAGELRYVLGGAQLRQRKPQIARWVEDSCTEVDLGGTGASVGGRPAHPAQDDVLYDCGPSF